MGRLHDLIADALAAELLARTDWDEPPALCFLYVEAGRPRISALLLPDEMWSADRPPAVLARFAAISTSHSSLLASVAPEGLHGAAFRCEAWEIDAGKPGTARRSEALADSMAHRIEQRPDAKEIRSIYAVDRAGITYAAVQRRGEDDVRRSIAYPGAGSGFSGTIPCALDQIVTAVLGVAMPGRKG